MIVVVDAGATRVEEAEDLKRLAVRAPIGADTASLAAAFGDRGRVDDDGEHVWLDVAALRSDAAATQPADGRDAWMAAYDAMIAYAVSKGWTDASGTAVRAHIERA